VTPAGERLTGILALADHSAQQRGSQSDNFRAAGTWFWAGATNEITNGQTLELFYNLYIDGEMMTYNINTRGS
jgi:hypothetical protein